MRFDEVVDLKVARTVVQILALKTSRILCTERSSSPQSEISKLKTLFRLDVENERKVDDNVVSDILWQKNKNANFEG